MPLIEDDYDPEGWLALTRKFKDEPEKGRRCDVCYAARLARTAERAAREGFDAFATVMSLSPWKKAAVDEPHRPAVRRPPSGLAFLEADFKKKDGFKKSVDLSKAHGLYRQDYCGCLYSLEAARQRTAGDARPGCRPDRPGRRAPDRLRRRPGRRLPALRLPAGPPAWASTAGSRTPAPASRSTSRGRPPPSATVPRPPCGPACRRWPRSNGSTSRPARAEGLRGLRDPGHARRRPASSSSRPTSPPAPTASTRSRRPAGAATATPSPTAPTAARATPSSADLPYDRPRTTMAGFPMCPDCRREYEDPLDRRHHAQPIACPACGPRLALRDARTGRRLPGDVREAAALIRPARSWPSRASAASISSAIRSTGRAVARLRRIKARRTKPLALMARDLAAVRAPRRRSARPSASLLLSPRRPIVLLRKKTGHPRSSPPASTRSASCCPTRPSTACSSRTSSLVVATSSNAKDAPIIKDETEGVRRPVRRRPDPRPPHRHAGRRLRSSRSSAGRPLFVRRARGYVPASAAGPAGAARSDRVLVALGGELKDTVSLYKNGYVVTSQFLGDLDDYRNFGYFEETLRPSPPPLRRQARRGRHRPPPRLPDDALRRRTDGPAPLPRPAPLTPTSWPRSSSTGTRRGRRVLGVALDGYGYGAGRDGLGRRVPAGRLRRLRALRPRSRPCPCPAATWPPASRGGWPWPGSTGPSAATSPTSAVLRAIGRRAAAAGAAPWPAAASAARWPRAAAGSSTPSPSSAGTAPERLEFEAEAAMRFEARGRPGLPRRLPGRSSAAARPAGRIEISFALSSGRSSATSRRACPCRGHRGPVPRFPGRSHRPRRREGPPRAHGTERGLARRRGLPQPAAAREDGESGSGAAGFRVFRPVAYSPNDESLSLGQIALGTGPGSRAAEPEPADERQDPVRQPRPSPRRRRRPTTKPTAPPTKEQTSPPSRSPWCSTKKPGRRATKAAKRPVTPARRPRRRPGEEPEDAEEPEEGHDVQGPDRDDRVFGRRRTASAAAAGVRSGPAAAVGHSGRGLVVARLAAAGAEFGLEVVLEAAGDADGLLLQLGRRLGLDPFAALEGVPLAAPGADHPEAALVVLDAQLLQGIGELLRRDPSAP
ncbi:MAG: epoxyqueuosine reductase QueH [Desulfomicrobium escambiense]|nr:epoxyqueuosine reductase QueH [Desulfomicrobium escambiense]